MADAVDERVEELGTLHSIFPELICDPNDPYIASIEIQVAPTKPLPITFEPEQDVQRLAYLPPLRLDVALPAEYPTNAPLAVVPTTSPSWLPEHILRRIKDEAQIIWEEYGRGATLYFYIESLREQTQAAFGLEELTLPGCMRTELVDYSRRMKKQLFDKETFDCGVCLEPKKGSVCYRMQRCAHVFCIGCLQDYYNSCISEGHVNNIKCMSTECGKNGTLGQKKDRLLSPKELLAIPIARDQVERYVKIKRKKKIESDPSMIFCPRTWCQGAMRTNKYPKVTDVTEIDESDSEAEDAAPAQQEDAPTESGPEKRPMGTKGMDRLVVCEDCTLAFCAICLASWHGDFVRCQPRDATQLTEEEQASLNFINKNTTPCPYCSIPCQKSSGCNHMTCAQCQTHFCYLCSAWLNPDHVYGHFNDVKIGSCFQRLFDGVEGDMLNGEIQFAGPRGAEQMADFWAEEALRIQMEMNEEATR
ncbi:RING finger protein-like protein [Plenodomus tracheiphilus IPT5]|uniref:RBR-type E3 ubiquitin transferase n=1 Tax=Plenodomus tracheiphilus IPT5 TaxID=1408161 RepID=A0A6A7BIP8_9PLEO|nr:RING finger protein-like protein [Plenodomus tracheiphilus IPT5]